MKASFFCTFVHVNLQTNPPLQQKNSHVHYTVLKKYGSIYSKKLTQLELLGISNKDCVIKGFVVFRYINNAKTAAVARW